jgi:hypothetical protein
LPARGAGPAEHLPQTGEHLAEVGHVELAAEAAQAEWVSRPRAGLGVVLAAFVAVRVVSGGEAERQVSHVLNGTHRTRATRGPSSRSE